MKSRTIIIASMLALASAMAPAHAGKTPSLGMQAAKSGRVVPAPLTDIEKSELLFMREEEKLARDAYLNLSDIWPAQVFANIAKAETTHFNAVGKLLVAYALADPASSTEGDFRNPELQALYDELMVRGSRSLAEALAVGGLIEEVDIEDLTDALDATAKPDIRRVYENLLCGSRNHLRAFVRNLEFQGVAYEAQHLPQEEVDAIVDSPMERCGR